MSVAPSAQLILPSFEGTNYPEARLNFSGGMQIDAAQLAEVLGGDLKIGDDFELVVHGSVRAKNFRRGLRNEDGMSVDHHAMTITLNVDKIEPAV